MVKPGQTGFTSDLRKVTGMEELSLQPVGKSCLGGWFLNWPRIPESLSQSSVSCSRLRAASQACTPARVP